MEAERRTKKCSACGGETGYVRDMRLKNDLPFSPDFFDAALYRCPACGHFDFYEREEDRLHRAQMEKQAEESRKFYEKLPDYRCPACGQVGKSERCAYCGTSCLPVKGTGEPRREKAPEPGKKKRRWFGRDDDKPDWEG